MDGVMIFVFLLSCIGTCNTFGVGDMMTLHFFYLLSTCLTQNLSILYAVSLIYSHLDIISRGLRNIQGRIKIRYNLVIYPILIVQFDINLRDCVYE